MRSIGTLGIQAAALFALSPAALYVPAMHRVDAVTDQMIRSVLAYAENRLRLDPVPLDGGPRDPADLQAALKGLLGAPMGITNTYQVGIVRDAITALAVRDGASQAFHLPVVAETYDGWLSDIQAFTLTQEHAFAAFDSAVGGCAIAEGNVGGGTGMICHEFKGGTGTASRVVSAFHEPLFCGVIFSTR